MWRDDWDLARLEVQQQEGTSMTDREREELGQQSAAQTIAGRVLGSTSTADRCVDGLIAGMDARKARIDAAVELLVKAVEEMVRCERAASDARDMVDERRMALEALVLR